MDSDISPESANTASLEAKTDRRRLLAVLAALDSGPRWKIIDVLRGTRGKTIKALSSALKLTHSATSEHARILRSVGILKGELVDPDDLRTVYQRLNEDIVASDGAGVMWLDFGFLKVRLD